MRKGRRGFSGRLRIRWKDAAKYEQKYLDAVKASNLKDKEKLINESTVRLTEYKKQMMMISMKLF